jgi:beta-N-acetylhexosaminidase
VSLDAASLDDRDLVPFRAAAEAKVPAVIVSLAFYAAYDPVTPGALSPSIATELLRENVGFEGVAISDDLTSGAVAAGLGAPEAAVQALAAGADMVLVDDAGQARAARDAILAAVKSGGLAGERLDEAVGRVLDLKRERGLIGR